MRLKFLAVVPSGNPDYPFQPGQVIEVAKLGADLKRHVKAGVAVLVHDAPETPERSAETFEYAVVGKP